MLVKWVGGMWDLLIIYGKNKMWLLPEDGLKWISVTLRDERSSLYSVLKRGTAQNIKKMSYLE